MSSFDALLGSAINGKLNFKQLDDNPVDMSPISGLYELRYSFLNSTTMATVDEGYFVNAHTDYYSALTDYITHQADGGDVTSQVMTAVNTILKAPGLTDAYSDYFGDIAKLGFALDSSTTNPTADIAIGMLGNSDVTDDSSSNPHFIGASLDYIAETVPNASTNEGVFGDIWLNADTSQVTWTDASKGGVVFVTLLHEIGHSLGLKHPDDSVYGTTSPAIPDDRFSVMAKDEWYFDHGMSLTVSGVTTRLEVSGLQIEDIAAIQSIYGRNYDTRDGDTTYSQTTAFSSTATNGAFIYTIWDGAGNDTIDASAYTHGVLINLEQGNFSSIGNTLDSSFVTSQGTGLAESNVAIAYYAVIENATGTNDTDLLSGNEWNNSLVGGGGDDFLYGDASVSSISGTTIFNVDDLTRPGVSANANGSGDDTLVGGTGADTVYGGKGNDTLIASDDGSGNLEGDFYHGGGLTGTGLGRAEMTYSTDGTDILDYRGVHQVLNVVFTADGHGTVTGTGTPDELRSIESVKLAAGSYNDTIQRDSIFGGTVDAGGGIDTLDYHNVASAVDVTIASNGNGTVTSVSAAPGSPTDYLVATESLILTSGDDAFNSSKPLGGTIDGGDGEDVADYSAMASAIHYLYNSGALNVSASGAGPADTLTNFETLVGHAGQDILTYDYGYASVAALGGDEEHHLVFKALGGADGDGYWNADGIGVNIGENLGGFIEVNTPGIINVGFHYQNDVHEFNYRVSAEFSEDGTDITVHGIEDNDSVTVRLTGGGYLYQIGFGGYVFDGQMFLDYISDHPTDGNLADHPSIETNPLYAGNWAVPYLLEGMGYFYSNHVYTHIDPIASNTNVDNATVQGDVIKLAGSVDPADMVYAQDGENLVATDSYTGHTITVEHVFVDAATTQHDVKMEFADGTVHTMNFIMGQVFTHNGTTGNDHLTGSTYTHAPDVLNGLGGADTLEGLGGNDTLNGGTGDDTLTGGAGTDIALGGTGDDIIVATLTDGHLESDQYNGGGWTSDTHTSTYLIAYADDGYDTVDYSGVTSNLVVAMDVQGAENATVSDGQYSDTLTSIEHIVTGSGNDAFHGTNGTSDVSGQHLVYEGGAGNDSYSFDVGNANGQGFVEIKDTDGASDTLFVKTGDGADANLMAYHVTTLVEGGVNVDYVDLTFYNGLLQPADEVLTIRMLKSAILDGSGIDNIVIDGQQVPMKAVLDTYSADTAIDPQSITSDVFSAPGTGGSGVVGHTDEDGNLDYVQIDPSAHTTSGISYISTTYNVPMITSLTGTPDVVNGGYTFTMTVELYTTTYHFAEGSDYRLNVTNNPGHASLQIIDANGLTETIGDFETGHTTTGVGLLSLSELTEMQADPNIIKTYSGNNIQFVWDSAISSWTAPTTTLTTTQFFSSIATADGHVVDMQHDQLNLTGTSSGESLYGLDSRGDLLQGLAGSDYIYGYGGDDTIIAGTGDDFAYGSTGDDTYVVSVGDDVGNTNSYNIFEATSEGTDTLLIHGVTPSDVHIWADNSNALNVQYSSSDTIKVYGNGDGSTGTDVGSRLEKIVFDDGTTWDLTQGLVEKDNDTGHYLYGAATNDTINGAGGNDTIYAFAGNDTVEGGAGQDSIYGGDGNDTFIFNTGFGVATTSGADYIFETTSGGTDTVQFGLALTPDYVRSWVDTYGTMHLVLTSDADDEVTLYGTMGGSDGSADVGSRVEHIVFHNGVDWDLSSGLTEIDTDGDHYLNGSSNGDILDGRGGADTIYGYDGDDDITSGTGVDYLHGGAGDDVYNFKSGDSTSSGDFIYESLSAGSDTIALHGVNPEDVRMWTDSSNLYIQDASGDLITVYGGTDLNGANNASAYVENIAFDGGTVWDLTQGLQLHGSNTSSYLYGSSNDDFIRTGTGQDHIYGYGGDDTFVFVAGDSTGSGDYIQGATSDGTDTILLHGVNAGDVRMWTDATNLYIHYTSSDTITVYGGYAVDYSNGVSNYVEKIAFDDSTVWDLTTGLHMVADNTSHSSFSGSSQGDYLEDGTSGSYLYGYAGADTLIGGDGADHLYGGTGNDVYAFSAGNSTSGDYVSESLSEGTDTIALHGVAVEDVQLWTDSTNLYIQYASGDLITVSGGYDVNGANNVGAYVENIVFDDSTTWDMSAGLHLVGDSTGRYIYGSSNDDDITAGSAGDHLYGYNGDDSFTLGAGADYITGGNGADTFAFNAATAFSNVDTISDFSTGQNDVLDLRGVLSAYDPLTDALSDFVQIADSGSNSTVSIDRDGSGGTYTMTQIATLTGVTGLTDVDALVTAGHLLAA